MFLNLIFSTLEFITAEKSTKHFKNSQNTPEGYGSSCIVCFVFVMRNTLTTQFHSTTNRNFIWCLSFILSILKASKQVFNMADKDMFLVLRGHMKKEQYSKCIEVCNNILTQLPGDVDALRVKISSLIALDKIEEALKVCQNIKELSFEKAYCLYRLNKVYFKIQVYIHLGSLFNQYSTVQL